MFNYETGVLISKTVKPCDALLESKQRRPSGRSQAAVQFPYCILITVIVIICVFLVCYRKHLDKIAEIPPYSSKDFIRDQSQFYAELYQRRIRRIIQRSSANKTADDCAENGLKWRHNVKMCSDIPTLKTRDVKDQQGVMTDSPTIPDVTAVHNDVTIGGSWKPKNCIARHRVAIVIPYRDRQRHLTSLLNTLVPVLKSQNVHFQIFVSEQFGNGTFNKGILMNAAFKQALVDQDWNCFVFHDVDLIPETNLNMYTCPQHPRHMSVAIDEMGYQLPYEHLVGGVFVLRTQHFQKLNGYSNSYWGWGAEDDDMSVRIQETGLRIDRPPYHIARYRMLKHTKREAAEFRRRYIPLSKTKYRFHVDGLNNLKYKLISKTAQPLFTHLLIDVGTPPA